MVDIIHFNSYSKGWEKSLSNFSPDPVEFEGRWWETAEHAYQASKTIVAKERDLIQSCHSPNKARQQGKTVTLRDNWNTIKLGIMRKIIKSKINNNLQLRRSLIDSGDTILVHEAPWDSFWGDGRDGKGHNMLGLLYMELRSKLQKVTK